MYWDSLERSRIDEFIFQGDQNPSELHGLARLLFFEESIRNYGDEQNYQKRRRLKKIQDVEDSAPSGYADHEIPYGERFTAPRYHIGFFLYPMHGIFALTDTTVFEDM